MKPKFFIQISDYQQGVAPAHSRGLPHTFSLLLVVDLKYVLTNISTMWYLLSVGRQFSPHRSCSTSSVLGNRYAKTLPKLGTDNYGKRRTKLLGIYGMR